MYKIWENIYEVVSDMIAMQQGNSLEEGTGFPDLVQAYKHAEILEGNGGNQNRRIMVGKCCAIPFYFKIPKSWR